MYLLYCILFTDPPVFSILGAGLGARLAEEQRARRADRQAREVHGPSFAYSFPMHPVHTCRDRVASLPPCRLYGAVIPIAPPLGLGRALTLPCGWNNAGHRCRGHVLRLGALHCQGAAPYQGPDGAGSCAPPPRRIKQRRFQEGAETTAFTRQTAPALLRSAGARGRQPGYKGGV